MTDYNDGSWHGWNGGECPVHHASEIEGVYSNATQERLKGVVKDRAGAFSWGGGDLILVAFRVTKEHREPREFWLVGGASFDSEGEAEDACLPEQEIIHVREVL